MTAIGSRYRGTIDYQRVTAELVTAARYRGTTTYQAIAILLGLPLRGSHMGREVGQVLGEISEDEHNAGRPMLSAVAVNAAGRPGPGFFALAEKFGRLNEGASKDEKIQFWEGERDNVHDLWGYSFGT